MAKQNLPTDADSDFDPATRPVGYVIVEGRSGERLMRKRYYKDDAAGHARVLEKANTRAAEYPDGGHVIDLEDDI